MVAATIRMAHDLGLSTIAEGIETEDDLATIRRLGCRYAQGYHFARPMPGGGDRLPVRRESFGRPYRYTGLISAGTDARRA